MKKIVIPKILILSLAIMISLFACGESENAPELPDPAGYPVLASSAITSSVVESREIGRNWYYGPNSVWGDTLAGVRFNYEDEKIDGQYFSTYNLVSRETRKVLDIPVSRFAEVPSIFEDKVVWTSVDAAKWEKQMLSSKIEAPLDWDIFLLDLKTGKTEQLTAEEHAQIAPGIYGDNVVWLDGRHNTGSVLERYDLYVLDLNTRTERRLTSTTSAAGWGLSLNGDLVVWTDSRHHPDPDSSGGLSSPADYNNEIYVYDLAAGQERRITTSPLNDHSPQVCGRFVTWLRQIDFTRADVFMFDLHSGEEIQVSQGGYAASTPSINGDYIVWMDARDRNGNISQDPVSNGQPGGAEIYLYDINLREEKQLTSAYSPDNGGQWLVWHSPVISNGYVICSLSRETGSQTYVLRLPEDYTLGY